MPLKAFLYFVRFGANTDLYLTCWPNTGWKLRGRAAAGRHRVAKGWREEEASGWAWAREMSEPRERRREDGIISVEGSRSNAGKRWVLWGEQHSNKRNCLRCVATADQLSKRERYIV